MTGPARLARRVRRGDQDAARVQVIVGLTERRRKIVPVGHEGDRVIHEDGIEGLSEGESPHIPLDEPAAGVEPLGLGDHGGAQVQTRDSVMILQVEHILAAPAADVQQSGDSSTGIAVDHARHVVAVGRVLLGGVPP